MAKFNKTETRPSATSVIVSEESPSAVTHEGAPGYVRDLKSELFLLAVSNLVSEDTFYEGSAERDVRYRDLVRQVARDDLDWLTRMTAWLRNEANMRSAALVAAAEAVKIATYLNIPGSRRIVDAALARADEPGEILAYWTSHYGRALPKPLKRGVADAAERLYNERSLLKYDTQSHGYRFADVIELAHVDPKAAWQSDLFGYALNRRHNRDSEPAESLSVIRANRKLRSATDPVAWLNAERLNAAGMTWEDALSAVGSTVSQRELWEALIPSMGYMALLRNLRNFDEAGVSDEIASTVAERLADAEQVAKSRQLPMRFLSAYRAAPSLRWAWSLERALQHSLVNVPQLKGKTLVLVDRSGSMFDRLSQRSDLSRADAAAIFGSALATTAEAATLVQFGTAHYEIDYTRATSILRLLSEFSDLGGTQTAAAVRSNFKGGVHDRVVIVTDEQAWGGYYGENPTAVAPSSVPVYTWNLGGYRAGHGPSGSGNRHVFGGLSDAAFKMIPLLEAAQRADWPF